MPHERALTTLERGDSSVMLLLLPILPFGFMIATLYFTFFLEREKALKTWWLFVLTTVFAVVWLGLSGGA